jgi:SAM-dependent methyltransferase
LALDRLSVEGMIHHIPHAVSAGLQTELQAHQRGIDDGALGRFLDKFPTKEDLVRGFLAEQAGEQYADAIKEIPKGSRLLDIGVGFGNSSLYLAAEGYAVSAVEPSEGMCDVIQTRAKKYDLGMDIYNVTGEALDRLPVNGFDACAFNASFHHCDDPMAALRNCRTLLRPGGQLFLLNEPVLQFYRSKAKFYRQLEEHPEEMGHYGGNEHIYYHGEYLRMLRDAGFRNIRCPISPRYANPKAYLAILEQQKAGKIGLRKLYYGGVHTLTRLGPLGRPGLAVLRKLSMLQSYYLAVK